MHNLFETRVFTYVPCHFVDGAKAEALTAVRNEMMGSSSSGAEEGGLFSMYSQFAKKLK